MQNVLLGWNPQIQSPLVFSLLHLARMIKEQWIKLKDTTSQSQPEALEKEALIFGKGNDDRFIDHWQST